MRTLALVLALVAAPGGPLGGAAAAVEPGAAPAPARLVLTAAIDGVITQATRDYVRSALGQAHDRGAEALLLEMDTPGGLLEATRELVQSILDAPVPVLVYVTPPGARAGSAGVFVTLAAHVAAMAPTTHIGAAHPVSLFGGGNDEVMARKIENDTAAWARSLALARGRSADWAEKAVRESASLPAEEALAAGVIDLIAPDTDSLMAAIDGRVIPLASGSVTLHTRGARLEALARSPTQQVAQALANPDLLYGLLLLGLFLLFLEYKSPGLILPGATGAALLLLVLVAQLVPVNWFGVLLILAATGLLIAEIYVTSFGLLAAAGLACLVAGSYLLFDVPGSPLQVAEPLIWGVAGGFAAIVLGVGALLVRAQKQGPTSGPEAMAGEIGVLTAAVAPGQPGRVYLRGSYWPAVANQELATGSRVEVLRLESARCVVRPVAQAPANPGPEGPGGGN